MELGHSRRTSSLPWSAGALEGNFIAATLFRAEIPFDRWSEGTVDLILHTGISQRRICGGRHRRDLGTNFYNEHSLKSGASGHKLCLKGTSSFGA